MMHLGLRYKKNSVSSSKHIEKDTSYTQFYDEHVYIPEIKLLDIRTLGREGTREFEETLYGTLTKWQSNFNLERGPLIA